MDKKVQHGVRAFDQLATAFRALLDMGDHRKLDALAQVVPLSQPLHRHLRAAYHSPTFVSKVSITHGQLDARISVRSHFSARRLVVSHIVTHTTANTMSESQTSLLGAMDESRESESSTTDGSRKNAVCGLLTDEEFSLRSLHTSHEVDETSNPPFFDKLPAEIRNMVYDFAFGHRGSEAFDVVIKRDWVQERMEARKNRRYRSLVS